MIEVTANIPVPTTPRLISLEKLMDMTSLHRSMVYRLIDQRVFTRVKIGSKTTFIEAQVIAWINARIDEANAKLTAEAA